MGGREEGYYIVSIVDYYCNRARDTNLGNDVSTITFVIGGMHAPLLSCSLHSSLKYLILGYYNIFTCLLRYRIVRSDCK